MEEELQETADLICSLQAKKLALMFFGRKMETEIYSDNKFTWAVIHSKDMLGIIHKKSK